MIRHWLLLAITTAACALVPTVAGLSASASAYADAGPFAGATCVGYAVADAEATAATHEVLTSLIAETEINGFHDLDAGTSPVRTWVWSSQYTSISMPLGTFITAWAHAEATGPFGSARQIDSDDDRCVL